MYICLFHFKFLCLPPSLASQKPVWRGFTSHTSKTQTKTLMPFVSTISTYMWYLDATPSKFSCATFKNLQTASRFVMMFLAHEGVTSWNFCLPSYLVFRLASFTSLILI